MPVLTNDGLLSVALAAVPTIVVAWFGHKNVVKAAIIAHEDKLSETLQKQLAEANARIKDLEGEQKHIRSDYEKELEIILSQSREERERNRTMRGNCEVLENENRELKEKLRARNETIDPRA